MMDAARTIRHAFIRRMVEGEVRQMERSRPPRRKPLGARAKELGQDEDDEMTTLLICDRNYGSQRRLIKKCCFVG